MRGRLYQQPAVIELRIIMAAGGYVESVLLIFYNYLLREFIEFFRRGGLCSKHTW